MESTIRYVVQTDSVQFNSFWSRPRPGEFLVHSETKNKDRQTFLAQRFLFRFFSSSGLIVILENGSTLLRNSCSQILEVDTMTKDCGGFVGRLWFSGLRVQRYQDGSESLVLI